MIQMIIIVLIFAVYFYFDNKYKYTDKICSFLKINTEKKAFALLIFTLFSFMLITMLNIFFNIPSTIYCLVSGLISGFGIGVLTNISHR